MDTVSYLLLDLLQSVLVFAKRNDVAMDNQTRHHIVRSGSLLIAVVGHCLLLLPSAAAAIIIFHSSATIIEIRIMVIFKRLSLKALSANMKGEVGQGNKK